MVLRSLLFLMKTFQGELKFLLSVDPRNRSKESIYDSRMTCKTFHISHRNLFCIQCSKNDGKSFFTDPPRVILVMGGNLLPIIEIDFFSSRKCLIIQHASRQWHTFLTFPMRNFNKSRQGWSWGWDKFLQLTNGSQLKFLSNFKSCVRFKKCFIAIDIVLRFSCFRFMQQRNFLFNFPRLGSTVNWSRFYYPALTWSLSFCYRL